MENQSDAAPVTHRQLLIEWGVRGGLAVLVIGALWAFRPGILFGTLTSPRALTLTAVVILLAAALEWWLRRRGLRAVWWRGSFYAIAVAMVAVGVVPSFFNVTVDTQKSEVFNAAEQTREAADPSESQEPQPVLLGMSEFTGIDHRASGDVTVVRDVDGSIAVRLENLDVEPGPDYFLEVVPGKDQRTPDGGVRLGKLQANLGNQEYFSDEMVEFETPLTVLIWCRAFAVPVANASVTA